MEASAIISRLKQRLLVKQTVWILPLLIAPLFLVISILHYGVNVPFQDDWNMVPLFQKLSAHNLTFSDLWRQRNEHRVFFPNIVMLVSAYATSWNLKAFMLIGFLLAFASAVLLYLLARASAPKTWLGLLCITVMSFWFFSPVQSENWLWGDQVIWFVCFTSILATIFLLEKFRTSNTMLIFYGALASGVVASFSLGGGLVVWIVGLAMLLAHRKAKNILIAWSATGLASTALYYYHYQRPESTQSFLTIVQQPVTFSKYFLALFGRPVSSTLDTAMLVGAMLLLALIPLLYVVWQNRAKMYQYVPWLAIIGFSLMMAGVTALARAGAGEGQSLSSRYCAFSVLYIVGILGLTGALINFKKYNYRTSVTIALCLLVINVPLLFASYSTGLYTFKLKNQQTSDLYTCSHASKPDKTCLSTLTVFDQATSSRALDYLQQRHWAGY